MTVRELLRALQSLPPDARVWITDAGVDEWPAKLVTHVDGFNGGSVPLLNINADISINEKIVHEDEP